MTILEILTRYLGKEVTLHGELWVVGTLCYISPGRLEVNGSPFAVDSVSSLTVHKSQSIHIFLD